MDTDAYDAVKSNDHRRLLKRLKNADGSFDISALNGAGLTMLHVACYQVEPLPSFLQCLGGPAVHATSAYICCVPRYTPVVLKPTSPLGQSRVRPHPPRGGQGKRPPTGQEHQVDASPPRFPLGQRQPRQAPPPVPGTPPSLHLSATPPSA